MGIESKIIIVGAGGSGKDILKARYVKKGFKPGISHTTRQQRKGEQDRIDYHFSSITNFRKLINQDCFLEWKRFNGWYYGISKSSFDSSEIFIMTPPAIREMSKEMRSKCFIIYIDIPEETRRKRLEKRNDVDSVTRRLDADRTMFKDFLDFDLKIINPFF